ncbi:hypothetical protein FALBO_3493 [Fusarium albosuccineum]|uniref:Uncharacterized protein n=1 Tax=Fusarium albosuccineum TaxID=1237068 RepID=A0A8H4LIY8_9HYPO|nr:hypothetical protein FALBO_3493 [Fusarium albosuccineum]
MEHVTVRVRLVEQTQPAAALAGLPNNCIEARQQMEQKNGEWGTKADKRPIASPQRRDWDWDWDWDWGTTPQQASLLLESELSERASDGSKPASQQGSPLELRSSLDVHPSTEKKAKDLLWPRRQPLHPLHQPLPASPSTGEAPNPLQLVDSITRWPAASSSPLGPKKINLQSPLAGMISPASLAIMSRTKTEATEQDCVLADISLSLKVGLGAVLVLRSLYQS